MPQKRPSFRIERINDMIQQTLGMLLLREVKDPRLTQVTISGVETSRDLSHAKIYFVISDEAQLPQVEKALTQAQGFFRSALAKTLELRTIPQLHFFYDASFAQGGKMDALIQKALGSTKSNA